MNNADSISFPLYQCYEELDLEILFTLDLRFSEYISKVTCKSNSTVDIIKQSFSCLNKAMFRTLYVSFLRLCLSDLEPIFNKRYAGCGKVQRVATKLVPELKHPVFGHRLSALNLTMQSFI